MSKNIPVQAPERTFDSNSLGYKLSLEVNRYDDGEPYIGIVIFDEYNREPSLSGAFSPDIAREIGLYLMKLVVDAEKAQDSP